MRFRVKDDVKSVDRVGIGDLNGDGTYDFIVKHPAGRVDPGRVVPSADTYKLDAYDGKTSAFLWRVDLGWNVNHGIWFSPMVVRDLDGDGRAEVSLRSAPVREDARGGIRRRQGLRPRRPRVHRGLRRTHRQGDRQGRLDRTRQADRVGRLFGEPLEPPHARRRVSRRQDTEPRRRARDLRHDARGRLDPEGSQAPEAVALDQRTGPVQVPGPGSAQHQDGRHRRRRLRRDPQRFDRHRSRRPDDVEHRDGSR